MSGIWEKTRKAIIIALSPLLIGAGCCAVLINSEMALMAGTREAIGAGRDIPTEAFYEELERMYGNVLDGDFSKVEKVCDTIESSLGTQANEEDGTSVEAVEPIDSQGLPVAEKPKTAHVHPDEVLSGEYLELGCNPILFRGSNAGTGDDVLAVPAEGADPSSIWEPSEPWKRFMAQSVAAKSLANARMDALFLEGTPEGIIYGEAVGEPSLPPVRQYYIDGCDEETILEADLVRFLPGIDPWNGRDGSEDAFAWHPSPTPIGLPGSPDPIIEAMDAQKDYPQLSVHTAGQIGRSRYITSRYSFQALQEEQDARRAESEALAEAVRAIAAEAIDDVKDSFPGISLTSDQGMEELAKRAFYKIASRCSYSDGIGDSVHENDPYGCLIEGESRCYGMASALKLVYDALGIPAYVANGYNSSGGRHAWTVCFIGGRWHCSDVTCWAGELYREPVSAYIASLAPVMVNEEGFYRGRRIRLDNRDAYLQLAYEALVGTDRFAEVQ